MSYTHQLKPMSQTLPLCWGGRWVVGTPEQFQWLYGLLKMVLVLNLFDAVLTLFWVETGLAREANILLQTVVSQHPVAFVVAKTALVSLGSWLLWHRRSHPLAVIGLVTVFIFYFSVTLHHVSFIGWAAAVLLF